LLFTGTVKPEVDVLYLCLGHGKSRDFLNNHSFSETTLIVDLGNDFRLEDSCEFQGKSFVYGLPELQKEQIEKATAIANPGCFATAIQLALLPLAKNKKYTEAIHINATTGSTGAGVGLSPTTHFSWRNNNLSWYKPFTHQHLGEIHRTLNQWMHLQNFSLCLKEEILQGGSLLLPILLLTAAWKMHNTSIKTFTKALLLPILQLSPSV
jgi:N-acetyl-gamma-glutamyl-phosphate reductase